MDYISTRGEAPAVSFLSAVEAGLAPDGGLYLPRSLPDITQYLSMWERLPYHKLCEEFFALFATDLPREILARCAAESYIHFDHSRIAPLVELDSTTYVLELFHGPTLAFKDYALQFLGNLYKEQMKRTGRPINVLGATSGDTGAAAIHGLLGKEGTSIFILYPNGRISPLQERQMACTGAENVHALAIEGSFDDAQAVLKEVFGDHEFALEVGLSAVNSINLARILAQCVYYIYGWFQVPSECRDEVEFVVPTGNFGNVLAGWMARAMGLPVRRFCVATNQNDILYRLFTTGTYARDKVQPSFAPSMDIQVASNFERYLFYMENGDSARVRHVMKAFRESGYHHFDQFDAGSFRATRANDSQISLLIDRVRARYDYICDPHTACAFVDLLDQTPASRQISSAKVILATAHPAKFPGVIADAIGQTPTHPRLEALRLKPMRKTLIRPTVEGIKEYMRAHMAGK